MYWYQSVNIKWKSAISGQGNWSKWYALVQMKQDSDFSSSEILASRSEIQMLIASLMPLTARAMALCRTGLLTEEPIPLGDFLCCFGTSWKCHKWFSLTSQSDVSDCKNDGNQWPVSRRVQVSPTVQHLTKSVAWVYFQQTFQFLW